MKLNVYCKSRGHSCTLPIKIARIMKLTGVLLLAACLQVSAASYSQKITLSEKNASLEKVFRKIMKQSDFMFLYNNEQLQKTKNVSVEARGASIESVLNQCFNGQPVTYAIFEKTVVVKPLSGDVNSEPLPPVKIAGKVVDETNLGLPGVSIALKGTSVSAITDANGNFTITVPEENVTNGTLVFSFLGYQRQEIPVSGRTAINIKLTPESQALTEVVVVGYGTQKRGDVSQAITSVNVEKMKDVPVTNLSQALQGRVPGLVSIPNSYRPGSGSSIRIRGNRSLTATNEPLYVVDGIPITYSIDDINPLDIESVDVLKDAAATAIYGSRGANGVIQVTTKKGKAGKISIDYNGNTSVENILREVEVYNGPEFAQFRRDAYIGSGVYSPTLNASNLRYFPDPAADYATFTSTDDALWNNVKQGYNIIKIDLTSNPKVFQVEMRPTTAEERALLQRLGYPVLTEVAVYDPSRLTTFDWGKAALQQGLTQNHNLSLTGGSDKFRSSFGGGYFHQKGIDPGQGYTRYSVSNNNNFRPADFINIGSNLNYSSAIQNQGPDVYSAALGNFPLANPYDAAGNLLFNPGGDALVVNPLNDPNTVFNEFRLNRLLANVFAQVNIVKGLSYRAALGVDLNDVRQGVFNGAISSVRQGNPASASYNTTNGFTWTLQNQLSYNLTLAAKHDISATVVQELRKERAEGTSVSAQNLTYESQKWYSLQNNTGGIVPTGTFRQTQLASHLGRINYSYDSKYIFTAALRHDASSVLSPENSSQLFPSASVAWRMSQEGFIKSLSFISDLKLRAGFGAVGNSGIQPYLTAGVLNSTPVYYNFGGTNALGYSPSSLPLPNLTWEKTVTRNAGADFALLAGRISGSVDVYESNTNSIQSKALPAASGYSRITVNLGKVRNRGVEVGLSTVNIDRTAAKKGGFKWVTDFAFSRNKEAIVALNADGATADLGNQWFVGQPIRNYYDFKSQGIFQYSDTLSGGILKDYYWKKNPANKAASSSFQPGRIRVEDVNGDSIINDNDKVNLGSGNPNWTGSINSTFSFRGFDLSAYVYISQGALLRDPRPGLVGRYPGMKVNYWTPTNPSNEYQQPNRGSDIPLYWQALTFRDASFVRVRSILLAYHVPSTLLNKIRMNSMTVSLNALNPFLFSKYKRYDPETVPYTSTYPSSSTANPAATSFSYRSFVLGLRMGI
ncbi:TonB-dependent receptor [Hufsiella ginkgonis]|uniref:SusC/RagA family TonB-linked outer membrane protein n=1 Tax=Hufsiella ginkgonis TaxID=2695274 RepID=A0A7K1Y263_9SPHI|nr:TonB-dependent receptor [Hufsiella ginkgonis]MXV17345.1 SusC/RagA family TonB-linked outer membrane protein [Hufsiella ginkgonis]